jgi:hypothetical protein
VDRAAAGIEIVRGVKANCAPMMIVSAAWRRAPVRSGSHRRARPDLAVGVDLADEVLG